MSVIESGNPIRDLANTITQRFDTDGDGRLSSDEFSGFLSQFLGGLRSNPLTAASVPRSSVSSSATAEPRATLGTMAGFDSGKLANLNHTSLKYTIGRVLQHYPNTPAGLSQALPELQQLVPGVKIAGNKGDLLDFGDYKTPSGERIGIIDVIQAAGSGGTAWQWAPVE
jgi:hypothetical protein